MCMCLDIALLKVTSIDMDWSHEIMMSEIQSVVTKLNYPWECIKLVVIFIVVVTESCAVRCFNPLVPKGSPFDE